MNEVGEQGVETPVGGFVPVDAAELSGMLDGYEVVELIACGGMGAVYRAEQVSLRREVAIKVLPRELSRFEEFQQSFKTEARAMAQLAHRNLVGVYDFGEVAGMLYLVMEHVDGDSLFEAAHGQLVDPIQAVEIVTGVAAGLGHAHANGILHRDLKPANILLTPDLVPKLGDFGLAVPADRVASAVVMGTPGYVAPEVLRDGETATPSSDVFSLGMVLHELLTGVTPDGEEQARLELVPNLRGLRQLVHKAIIPQPLMRHPDGSAMEEALHEWLEAARKLPPHVITGASGPLPGAIPGRSVPTPAPVSLKSASGGGAGTVTAFVVAVLMLAAAAIILIAIRGRTSTGEGDLTAHYPVVPASNPTDLAGGPSARSSAVEEETTPTEIEPTPAKPAPVITEGAEQGAGAPRDEEPPDRTLVEAGGVDPGPPILVPALVPEANVPEKNPREDGEFAKLATKCQEIIQGYERTCEQDLNRLATWYVDQLKVMKARSQRNGDFDASLMINEELARFTEDGIVTAADLVKRPVDLRKRQEEFQGRHERIASTLREDKAKAYRAYIRRLSALKRDLTKSGNLVEAKAAAMAAEEAEAELVVLGALDPPQGAIPEDAIAWGGHHYKSFEAGKISFDEARAKCEELGGHLVFIESPEEQEIVVNLDRTRTRWIGGSDKQDEGMFQWLDGTAVPRGLDTAMGRESSKGRDFLHLKEGGKIGCRQRSGY